jgi:hypothetical protein
MHGNDILIRVLRVRSEERMLDPKSEANANNILRAIIPACDPARAGKAQNKNAFPSLVIHVC